MIKFTEHPLLKGPSKEEILALTETEEGARKLLDWHAAHEEALKLAVENPVYYGFRLSQQEGLDEALAGDGVNEAWVLGGVRCLGGEQLIYRADTDELVAVEEINEPFEVFAFDEEERRVVRASASLPFRKPPQEIYQIELSDGTQLSCSQSHRVLANGQWCSVSELSEKIFPDAILADSELCDLSRLPISASGHLLTILDICQSTCLEDVRRSLKIVLDSLGDCLVYSRFGDGPLLPLSGSDRSSSPSLACVQEYIECAYDCLGDLDNKPQYIRLYLLFDHPTKMGDLSRLCLQVSDILSGASCKPYKSASRLCEDRETPSESLRLGFDSSHQSQSIHGFAQRDIRFYYVLPSGDEIRAYSPVVKSTLLRVDDVWDFSVDTHHNYMIGSCCNHNSSKSYTAAKIVMRALIENPGTIISCWAQNEAASVERQQPYLHEMLPKEYLSKEAKAEGADISYHPLKGFSGNKFALPNGSICLFKFYSQFQNDDTVIEGARFGCPENLCKYTNIGVWCDEYLGDEELLKRLRSRCGDYSAKVLVTFTPQRGYTPTVGTMLDNCQVLRSREAEHPVLEGERMPLEIKPDGRDNVRVLFFHTEQNPFINKERLFSDHMKSTDEEIKKVLYGWPTRSMTAMFSMFGTETHLFDPTTFGADWSHVQVIDPAGAKSWWAIWAAVNKKGDIRIWAEFPNRSEHGEWAVEGRGNLRDSDKVNWKKGPAAEGCGGLSLASLCLEFSKIEGQHKVEERIVDSRFVAGPHQTKDFGARTLQDDLADMGMYVTPASGADEDSGIGKIQEALAYDRSKPYCPFTNAPRLMISRECGNLIHALQNYSKSGKFDEAIKDPIDSLRYLLNMNGGHGPVFVNKTSFAQVKPQGVL